MQTVTQFIAKHIGPVVIALGAVLVFVTVVREHDARLIAEQQVKASESREAALEQQFKTVASVAKVEVTKLQKQAATVKTPAQAVQAIPDLSLVPLNVRPAPGLPTAVVVEAVPLFKDLNQAKQDATNLEACTKELGIATKVEAEKDIQIEAWKRKPRFWHRVKTTAITVGIGAALGYAAAHR